jgi:hypothetical protein
MVAAPRCDKSVRELSLGRTPPNFSPAMSAHRPDVIRGPDIIQIFIFDSSYLPLSVAKDPFVTKESIGKLGPLLPADPYRVAPPNEPTHTATQPRSHRSSVSSGRSQLSCFKLRVRGPPRLALLAGGLGISTDARQPLELKCSARDRMMIQQAVS